MSMQPYILLCTVGTSLESHLKKWRNKEMSAFAAADWEEAAQRISRLEPQDWSCGAEINSIHALLAEKVVTAQPEIHFFHSDTDAGRDIGCLLKRVYELRGWRDNAVRLQVIEGLRDSEPKLFRTQGLRNLVRQLCDRIRQYGPSACAINATGGYKAQIAIAVMIGQALGVPVYYKHERFTTQTIIGFPPLPVALDEELWRNNLGIFEILYQADDFVSIKQFAGEWDEKLESLVERDIQDGETFLILSSAGLIMHENFRDRIDLGKVEALKPAKRQEEPRIGPDHISAKQAEIRSYMQRVTQDNPFVRICRSFYANPDQPQKNDFRLSRGQVVGIYSDGSFSVKFRVETTAASDEQKWLVVDKLRTWRQERG